MSACREPESGFRGGTAWNKEWRLANPFQSEGSGFSIPITPSFFYLLLKKKNTQRLRQQQSALVGSCMRFHVGTSED